MRSAPQRLVVGLFGAVRQLNILYENRTSLVNRFGLADGRAAKSPVRRGNERGTGPVV